MSILSKMNEKRNFSELSEKCDKVKAKSVDWNRSNKEKKAKAGRKWYKENKVKVTAQAIKWNNANIVRKRAIVSKYSKANWGKGKRGGEN